MSPWVALAILTWVAIVVCYLGLAAVLREVRMLRHQVSRLSFAATQLATGPAEGAGAASAGIRLPAQVVGESPGVLLVATSGCPLCRVVLARVGELGDAMVAPVTLLTYEDAAVWGELPAHVRVVRDDAAWSEVAHLSPPVLLRVTAAGAVTDIVLPVDVRDVDTALSSWGALPQTTGR